MSCALFSNQIWKTYAQFQREQLLPIDGAENQVETLMQDGSEQVFLEDSLSSNNQHMKQ